MHLSRRSHLDRQTNELTGLLRELRARGAPVLDLTASNPTRVGLPQPLEAIAGALARAATRPYSPEPFGEATAREAVAACLAEGGAPVDPERIVLTASTSEAYGLLFKLLCDPGDRVLVPAPSYPLLDHLAAFEAVVPVAWPLRWEGGWWMDRAGVRDAIDARTRAIVLVSPNNPTGSFTRRDDLRWLGELGLPLISDEVFAPYRLCSDDPRDRGGAARSALELQTGLVFALGGLSKLAGLPQLKLGWMALGGDPAPVREAMGRLELMADAALSVATPVQAALPELLRAAKSTRRAIAARLARNRDALDAGLGAGSRATALRVEGGWSAPVRLPATRDAGDWALRLLREHGLLVHPGDLYGFERMEIVVLSLLVPEEAFARGVQILRTAVEGA